MLAISSRKPTGLDFTFTAFGKWVYVCMWVDVCVRKTFFFLLLQRSSHIVQYAQILKTLKVKTQKDLIFFA